MSGGRGGVEVLFVCVYVTFMFCLSLPVLLLNAKNEIVYLVMRGKRCTCGFFVLGFFF